MHTFLNKGTTGELEKRVQKAYASIFFENYEICKNDNLCTKFTIHVNRDIDAGPIERTFTKCAKDNNLNLEHDYDSYLRKDIYIFSFA